MRDTREAESLWWPRLRWRLRGAWLWPAFVLLTVGDALLLGSLPLSGDDGTDFVPALLLAGFFNLLAVAVLAPMVGILLRRRRPDLPRVVADDYAGTALVALVSTGLLAGGLAHRPRMQDAQHDWAVQQLAAQRYIARSAPPEHRARASELTSVKVDDELFRTCAPGDDPKRWFCVFVATDSSPPGITVDGNRESNASFDRASGYR